MRTNVHQMGRSFWISCLLASGGMVLRSVGIDLLCAMLDIGSLGVKRGLNVRHVFAWDTWLQNQMLKQLLKTWFASDLQFDMLILCGNSAFLNC